MSNIARRTFKRLNDLLDVNISSPTELDFLAYDSAGQQWVNSTVSRGVYETAIYIDAGAMVPADSAAGPDALVVNAVSGGGTSQYDVLVMATGEDAWTKWAPPPQWDGNAVDVTFYWTATGAATPSTDNVSWEVAIASSGDDDSAGNPTYGATSETADDPVLSVGDLQIIEVTGVAIGGTFADGDYLHIKVTRGTPTGNDMTEDAHLLGIRIKYSVTSIMNWYSWKLGDETTDVTTTGKKTSWTAPAAGKIHDVEAGVTTRPVGSAMVFDVELGEPDSSTDTTTIFSTRPQVDVLTHTSVDSGTTPALTTDPTSFSAGDEFEFFVDTAPSSGGAGPHVSLLIEWI